MTYVDRLNLFWQFAEAETLSSNQIAFYTGLLNINNSCFWTEWFSVANSRIEHLTGIKTRTIYDVKNQLKQMGLIDYKEIGRNKPCKYKICDIAKLLQSNRKAVAHLPQSNRKATATLIDKDKDIDIDNSVVVKCARETEANIYRVYEENIGTLTGIIVEELDGYVELTCPEVVIYAIKQAAINNKKSCGYVKGICKSLLNEGIKTPLDLDRHIQEYEQRKISNKTNVSTDKEMEAKIAKWGKLV